jgi:hypothetical protein
MGGEFFEQETTEGAMRVLWRWIELYGIPRALYTDHKNLYVAHRQPTKDEQLAGRPALSAFGKACHKLGIQIIPAASPQAKGRIERRHGVLQDRLVKELRLRGIKDLSAANAFLATEFLQGVNGKFAHSAVSSVNYHRPVPKALRLKDVFVFEEQRTVQNDWTIAWDGRWFQITGPRAQMPRRHERIVVRHRLDGSRVLLRHGKLLEFHELPGRPRRPSPRPSDSQMQPISRPTWAPPADHPWRQQGDRDGRLRAARRAGAQIHRELGAGTP